MSKTLHGWETEKGRVLLGGKGRDKHLRNGPEVFDKAQERKKRRAELRLRNLIRSGEGRCSKPDALAGKVVQE